jgi:hypothetical protein
MLTASSSSRDSIFIAGCWPTWYSFNWNVFPIQLNAVLIFNCCFCLLLCSWCQSDAKISRTHWGGQCHKESPVTIPCFTAPRFTPAPFFFSTRKMSGGGNHFFVNCLLKIATESHSAFKVLKVSGITSMEWSFATIIYELAYPHVHADQRRPTDR